MVCCVYTISLLTLCPAIFVYFLFVARRLSTAAEQHFAFTIQTTFKLHSFFVLRTLCTWHGYQIVIRITQPKKNEEVERENEWKEANGGKGLAATAAAAAVVIEPT